MFQNIFERGELQLPLATTKIASFIDSACVWLEDSLL